MNRKVFYIIIAILIFFGLLAGGYFWLFKTTPKLTTANLRVGNSAFAVEIADTLRTRAQGLSGRESLGENSGMLFVFQIPLSYSFWMKDMRFPLDMVWIRKGTVIGATENVPLPSGGVLSLPTYSPPGIIDQVLEINAGVFKKFDLKIGDSVILEK
jgi:uncharacterized membrane protein (UPF0127 family)